MINILKAALDEKLASAGRQLVVIDFGAVWCGPCKDCEPTFKVSLRACRSTERKFGAAKFSASPLIIACLTKACYSVWPISIPVKWYF